MPFGWGRLSVFVLFLELKKVYFKNFYLEGREVRIHSVRFRIAKRVFCDLKTILNSINLFVYLYESKNKLITSDSRFVCEIILPFEQYQDYNIPVF